MAKATGKGRERIHRDIYKGRRDATTMMQDSGDTAIVKLCKPKEEWSMANVGGVFLPFNDCQELERMPVESRERFFEDKISDYSDIGLEAKIDLDKKTVALTPVNSWKSVARGEYSKLQSSGYAPTLEPIKERCDSMDSWKECALDILGYTDFS